MDSESEAVEYSLLPIVSVTQQTISEVKYSAVSLSDESLYFTPPTLAPIF